MKKKILLGLSMMLCLLFSACSTTTIEGTWYSLDDTTMYNFEGGDITVSGNVVGQYEDNGDSVVISLSGEDSNLKLYITKMDDIDVLADVKSGDGTIYFCKGLENAQTIIDQQEAKIEEVAKNTLDNITGKWIADTDEDPSYPTIEFNSDNTVTRIDYDGTTTKDQIVLNSDGTIRYEVGVLHIPGKDGSIYEAPTVTIYLSPTGTMAHADEISISASDEPDNEDRIYMYSWFYNRD